jgi:hypothetical protein
MLGHEVRLDPTIPHNDSFEDSERDPIGRVPSIPSFISERSRTEMFIDRLALVEIEDRFLKESNRRWK